MARILTSLIFLAAYLLATGQSEAAQCLGTTATVEITHAHGHEHHHENHASEAQDGQEPHSHTHEIVVGGCACIVVPGPSVRLFEAPASGTAPLVSEPSAPYAASTRSIFRPPIA